MSDTNELVVYVDAFAEEVAQEIGKLFGSAIARYRSTGAALDQSTLIRARDAVRAHVQQLPEVLGDVLGQRSLAAGGDSSVEGLKKRWSGLNKRIR